MATRQTATIARLMRMPSIVLLLVWMIVPLAMTVYFSFRYYNLLNPAAGGWAGFENYSTSSPTRPSGRRSATRSPSSSACSRSP